MPRKAFVVFAIVLILIGLSTILYATTYPRAILKWTDQVVQNELNNQYINKGYLGWTELCFEEHAKILITEKWVITKNNDQLHIYEENLVVATISRVRNAEKTEADTERYSKEIEAIQFGFFPFLVKTREIRYLTIPNLGNGASYYAVTCYGTNNEQETHYVLTLKNSISDFTYYMDFGELEGEDDPYYDYLVAMAYSFNRQ